MKYFFMLSFALGIVLVSSAQQVDRGGNKSGWSIQINRYPAYGNPVHGNNVENNVRYINRAYDWRIREIQNDYTLSRHKQRKMIRQINEERKDRLKAIKKWQRKHHRKFRDDDDFLYGGGNY